MANGFILLVEDNPRDAALTRRALQDVLTSSNEAPPAKIGR